MNADSTCKIDRQTAAAMHVVYGIYDELEPLKAQLARLVEEMDFHHDCGMLGLPHLWEALNLCGLQEYAYRILTASGYPSYRNWIEDGATTLYEMWNMEFSQNHHMYSCFMAWMMSTIIGIRKVEPAYSTVRLEPYFFDALDWVKGYIDTPVGRLCVEWKREADVVHADLTIPEGVTAVFRGQTLSGGSYSFKI